MGATIEEKKEAAKAASEYVERLLPAAKLLAEELRGQKSDDTDTLLEQFVNGMNWTISIYKQVNDVWEVEEEKPDKEKINEILIRFSRVYQEKNAEEMAREIENGLVSFLENLKNLFDKIAR